MRDDFPFFSSIGDRGPSLADDVALLPWLADAGLCAAAKDVSMAGVLGSLAMLLEPTRCGVEVDLESLPTPENVSLARWASTFPTFAFLITAPRAEASTVRAKFRGRDLDCEQIGTIDSSGRLRIRLGQEEAQLLNLSTDSVTGLTWQESGSARREGLGDS